MWPQTDSTQVRPTKTDHFCFLAGDDIRQSLSTESGLHLEEKDAGQGVFGCNRRSRSCRAIHQLVPEHFETATHDLQGRLQKRNRNTSVLSQSWQYSVCSTKCQRTRAAMQRTSQLHRGGWISKCALSYFHSNFFPNSFFLTLNFHMSSKARFLEKPQQLAEPFCFVVLFS